MAELKRKVTLYPGPTTDIALVGHQDRVPGEGFICQSSLPYDFSYLLPQLLEPVR